MTDFKRIFDVIINLCAQFSNLLFFPTCWLLPGFVINKKNMVIIGFPWLFNFYWFSTVFTKFFLFVFFSNFSIYSPGLLSVWGWDKWLKSPIGSHHTDNWHLWANALLQWGKPRAAEDSMCTGCLQTAEEAWPVPSCQYLRPSLLVRSEHWQKWWRGMLKMYFDTHALMQYFSVRDNLSFHIYSIVF